MSPAATLIVFGRGVLAGEAGHALTPGGVARVHAAVDYVRRHRAHGYRPLVVFTGGWSEVAEGTPAPPAGHREGDLMARLAAAEGLPEYADAVVESRSRSTLENLLNVVADGLLAGRTFDARHPLGLVSHRWHLPRIRFLAARVLGLRGPALLDIPVTTGDLAVGGPPAPVVLLAARLGFLGARTPAALRRRERLLVAARHRMSRHRRRWGKPPV